MIKNKLNVMSDARDLVFGIYGIIGQYPNLNYSLNQQITRAAISVGSNVIEGQRRGKKEFCRFLDIAIGSCSEVQFQLSLFPIIMNSELTLKPMPMRIEEMNILCNKIIGQLVNLKKSIKSRDSLPTALIP